MYTAHCYAGNGMQCVNVVSCMVQDLAQQVRWGQVLVSGQLCVMHMQQAMVDLRREVHARTCIPGPLKSLTPHV